MNARHALALGLVAAALAPLVAAKETHAGLDSGPLDQGESFSFLFEGTGTFSYLCRPHPYMKAVVVVAEGDAAGPVNATIQGYAFHPLTIRVGPGANVTWTNQDDVVHTVSSVSGGAGGGLEWWMVLVPVGLLVPVAALVLLGRKPR